MNLSGPAPVQVSLSDLDDDGLRRHAQARHEEMLRAAREGHAGAYGRSTPRMQEVGLTGEYALAHWLTGQGNVVDLIGDDPSVRTSGDVAVVRHHATGAGTDGSRGGGWVSDWVTFEVKTSRETDWNVYARTLDQAQLGRCTANAYVWAVLLDRWGARRVRLMGWMPVDDLRGPTTAPNATRPACVHGRPHVRVHAPMRPMADLPGWIAEQSSPLDLW